jgi:hypothetical protein
VFEDFGFESVLEGEPIVTVPGAECAGRSEELVGDALNGGDSFGLDVINCFVDVIQRGIVADLIDAFNALNEMLTGKSEFTFHGQGDGIGDGLRELEPPGMSYTCSLLFERVVGKLDD